MYDSKRLQWINKKLPWTVNVADEVTTPRIFFALHVYTPPSSDITSLIARSPRDCMIRLSAGRLEFSFSHVTWGTGFPFTSHCSDATPVLLITMDIGGNTIEGAEMDPPGSPLGPWEPWSPLGPGGPWFPWGPLGPWGPWGPTGPCLPRGPGLPRLPLTPFGQCAMQARLLIASLTSLFMSSRLMISLSFVYIVLIRNDHWTTFLRIGSAVLVQVQKISLSLLKGWNLRPWQSLKYAGNSISVFVGYKNVLFSSF